MKYLRNESGIILPIMLATAVVVCAIGYAIAGITLSNMRYTTHEQKSQSALDVAEAGIDYYLWHLSHNTTDYKDGGTTPAAAPYGPYVHDYTNASGKKIGTFTLYITPPTTGSTVTTVQSIGQVNGLIGKRTVQAQLGIPSFASYGLLTNTAVWFGSAESTSGPIHSNGGVHMDGANDGPVTSAVASYTSSTSNGGNGTTVRNGVWGNGGPTSQWQYPVPTVDFTRVTSNMQTLKTLASSGGVSLAASGKLGYYLKLKANGSIDIYTVKNESDTGMTTTFIRNQAAPGNGVFYVNDNVWVDGAGYAGRMTIASGVLPDSASTNTTITVVGNITYNVKDGTTSLGLIAQKDVLVAPYAPDTLEIDAAVLAQKGHVWYPNGCSSGSCNPIKTRITFYGSIDSYDTWTWTWVNGSGNVTEGYRNTSTTFDSHLTFTPPPNYPTTGSFAVLNWRELLTKP